MTVRRGTYVLLITLGSDLEVEVGSLGTIFLNAGTYCYTGSAMGGIDQRVSRHLSKVKTIRWHIDRITSIADSVEAYESYPDPVPECILAGMAQESGMIPAVCGFGCSDCSCRTHLFRVTYGSIKRLISMAGMKPFHDSRQSS